MHQLAELSDEERRRLITDFIDEAFGGLDAYPEFVAMMRPAMPELTEAPAPAQLEAWVELAQLSAIRPSRPASGELPSIRPPTGRTAIRPDCTTT
jgi:hypothetical protein